MNGRVRAGMRGVLAALPLLLLVACHVVIHRDDGCEDGACEPAAAVVPLHEPKLCKEPSMHAMACDLDHLEKHIDWYGSVTAKTPDVWGQARLTSYRQETERRLRNELDGFRISQQGSIGRIDTADLLVRLTLANPAQSLDVSAAAEANAKAAKTNAETAELQAKTATAAADAAKADAAKLVAAVTALEAAADKLAKAAANPVVITAGTADTAADPDGIVAGALARGTALEPVRILEQKDRYLSYLNQLRRKNEGDDTSDAPGYSLNLVRIPVSLLPGKKTDRGYGAEMTFTITPILDDDLLPVTYRELVVNDLLHLMAFPLTKLLEDDSLGEVLDSEQIRRALLTDDDQKRNAYLTTLAVQSTAAGMGPAAMRKKFDRARALQTDLSRYARVMSYSVESKGVRPFPPTQLPEVVGPTFLYEIVRLARNLTKTTTQERGKFVHMPDVQAVLREHLIAAHRFLARPESRHLWETFCTPDLVDAVRTRNQEYLNLKRREFRCMVQSLSGTKYADAFDNNLSAEPYGLDKLVHFSATTGLAWAILVDSALLNERLKEDMKRTESVAGIVFPTPDCPQYFLPDPPPAERQAFNQYVTKRWPIHVFTLDPATDDQNLADSLTSVRNTQLALTLAFVRGRMSTNAFVNAIRRVESKYETIALNRTQVGFAHGDNTFGWRFYPRFQTPPVKGNVRTFVGENLLGINNPQDGLRTRRLEPGPRECVAVVLMPSFVPHATLDAVGNWFALANPKHKAFDHTQALHLSRTVQALRTDGCGVRDAHKYRADDQRLLLARADQLAARLPLQSTRFQVPTVNSYGGFELFGNTTTDLAPELYGWYGAPGLKACEDTTLFLVGDHFSVNHTRILVGNAEVKEYKMLSRQVMKVTVPKGVLALPAGWAEKGNTPHAHIHIATPYGVSRELEIPLVCDPHGCAPCAIPPAESEK